VSSTVVLLPPTLVASIYGMNFKSIPELEWAFGYPYALCLIVVAAVVAGLSIAGLVDNAKLFFTTALNGLTVAALYFLVASGFTLDGATTCPQLSTSSAAGTMAAGTSCTYAVDFIPAVSGLNSGSLVLTDNNLNTAGPGYATQSIGLNGTGTGQAPAITQNDIESEACRETLTNTQRALPWAIRSPPIPGGGRLYGFCSPPL